MSSLPPLTQHLDTLYTMACTLVGSDAASDLVHETYQQATQVPVRHRPEDRKAWLVELMLSLYNDPDTAYDEHGIRSAAAESLVLDALPAAWAVSSVRDRTLLTTRVALSIPQPVVAELLDIAPDEVEPAVRNARASLRATLRDVLVGPTRMLIDVAFPDEALDESLRTFLANTYGSVPASLRARTVETLRRARTPSEETRTVRQSRRRSQWLKTGGVIAGLLVLVALAWGIRAWWTAPDPPSEMDLLDFSAQHGDVLQPVLESEDPDSLAAFWEAETGHTIHIPRIDRADLIGLAALPLEPTPVPVILFYDTDAQAPLRVFGYSYTQLDQLDDDAALPRAIRQTLDSEDTFVEESADGRPLLLWRVRDRVYVAVFAQATRDTHPDRVTP